MIFKGSDTTIADFIGKSLNAIITLPILKVYSN